MWAQQEIFFSFLPGAFTEYVIQAKGNVNILPSSGNKRFRRSPQLVKTRKPAGILNNPRFQDISSIGV